MEKSNEVSPSAPSLDAHIMPRPRIDALLDSATRGKLVYVLGGAGYGKTHAVQSYIDGQEDAVVRWIHLTESDNICSRYWENLTHSIAFDNPDLSGRLRELGFPDTVTRFNQFAQILKAVEHRSHKTFLVLDDFHLIHSKKALMFAERCAHLKIPGACVIIISRTEPEINAVALFAKGQSSIITEEELRFTEKEISDFLKMRSISFPPKNLPQFAEATGGWALAVQLLSLVLKNNPKDINTALDTLKQNVFKLMETEAWRDFPVNIKKTMVKLSIISELPLRTLWSNLEISSFLREAPQLASFIWFDSYTGQDRVHPLYWEFLKTRQGILSESEKRSTYKKAAQWCIENSFYMDAVKYLAKLRQFERIHEILVSLPMRLPYDICEFYLGILENLNPDENERSSMEYILLYYRFVPLMLAGMERYEQAQKKSLEAISRWENDDSPAAPLILGITYSNLAYIDMYLCTTTHEYKAAAYLKKAVQYQSRSTLPPMKMTKVFAAADVSSFACLVGEDAAWEEFGEFLAMTREAARYIGKTPHHMYSGYEDLAACELAFYQNRPEEAKRHAHEALIKAREKDQYSIEAITVMYLFRIAMLQGDYPLVKEFLRKGRDRSGNPDFWNRRFLYDLAIGFLYAQIGLPDMVPSWLVTDERETELEVSKPVRELICGAKYYIATKNYSQALTYLCRAYPRQPQDRFLLGELTLFLLTAVARIRTGDSEGAVRDFKKAYSMSFGGALEMPFVELGKEFRPLAGAARKGKDGAIPADWLATVGYRASAYAKKTAVILDSFKKEHHIEESVSLSQREQEVLEDLYQGLSRDEIAAARFLSVNTVNKVIQSVFIKLNAQGKADAIRIAIEKNLLKP